MPWVEFIREWGFMQLDKGVCYVFFGYFEKLGSAASGKGPSKVSSFRAATLHHLTLFVRVSSRPCHCWSQTIQLQKMKVRMKQSESSLTIKTCNDHCLDSPTVIP